MCEFHNDWIGSSAIPTALNVLESYNILSNGVLG